MKFAKMRIILVVAALMLASLSIQAQTDDPFVVSDAVVETESGQLRGFVQDGIYTYLGVKYAQAERFMMPEKVEPWEGVRSAVTYGEICPIPAMNSVANDELFNPHRYFPQSENCQHLNIWTPGIQDDAQRPVMVWLHGGGWTNGSSIEGVSYDGRNLSEKGDVVVVSLNHRLNVLGYLDMSAYGDYSANVGVADMVAALEWIQENIAEFGGDPSNVTIFGQSGGGGKVATLMSVPAAEGLFDKAIIQSGYVSFGNQEASQQVAELTLQNLGIDPENVEEIQDVPYEGLLAAASAAQSEIGGGWGPILDGDYIPEPAFPDFASDITLMVGSVLNEMTTVIRIDPDELLADNRNDWDMEYATSKMEERFGENGVAIAEAFLEAYPNKQFADAYYLDTSIVGRSTALNIANMKSEQEAPVYTYQFTYYSPVMDGVGMAWHCAEIPYVFDNADLALTATGGGDAAHAMAHMMSQAWINFARYGDPNHDALPEWPAYTPENGATMIFDTTPWVGFHNDAELLALLAEE